MNYINYLPDEVLWTRILTRIEDSHPQCRAVCKRWQVIIDGEHQIELESYGANVAVGQATEAVLKLKRFLPRCFDDLKSHVRECSTLPVEIFQKRWSSLDDLCEDFEPVFVSHMVKKIDSFFGKTLSLEARCVNAVLLKQHGDLIMSAKRGHLGAIRFHFGELEALEIAQVEKVFRKCLKNNLSISKRVFEVMLRRFHFQKWNLKFRHRFAHSSFKRPWMRKCMFNIERKMNALQVTTTSLFRLDRSGVSRGGAFDAEFVRTELHEAVESKDWKRFLQLVKRGDDLNVCDHAGTTPLMLAARGGDIRFFKVLLKKGVNLDQGDFWCLNAMDWCVLSGKPEWLHLCKKYKHTESKWQHAKELYKTPESCTVRDRPAVPEGILQFLNFLAN